MSEKSPAAPDDDRQKLIDAVAARNRANGIQRVAGALEHATPKTTTGKVADGDPEHTNLAEV